MDLVIRAGGGSQPASKYFPTTQSQEAVADDDWTVLAADGPGPVTTKSAYNRLARV